MKRLLTDAERTAVKGRLVRAEAAMREGIRNLDQPAAANAARQCDQLQRKLCRDDAMRKELNES